MTGHSLLQANNGVAATQLQSRHRAGRHGGDLRRGHVGKPGFIERLLGRSSEGPGRVFAAEQVEDVVDQRAHVSAFRL